MKKKPKFQKYINTIDSKNINYIYISLSYKCNCYENYENYEKKIT